MHLLGCVEHQSRTLPPDLTMCSSDSRVWISIGSRQLEALLDMCRQSGALETGGLLVGRYSESHDTAILTRLWESPEGLSEHSN